MKEFNQSKYIQNWIKENKKQFRVDLNKDEYDNLETILLKLKINKSDFLRNSIKRLQVSYECSNVIDDIKTLIEFEDENTECYIIYEKIDGYIIFTDCISIEEKLNLDENEFCLKTNLKDALIIFENQNKII